MVLLRADGHCNADNADATNSFSCRIWAGNFPRMGNEWVIKTQGLLRSFFRAAQYGSNQILKRVITGAKSAGSGETEIMSPHRWNWCRPFPSHVAHCVSPSFGLVWTFPTFPSWPHVSLLILYELLAQFSRHIFLNTDIRPNTLFSWTA